MLTSRMLILLSLTLAAFFTKVNAQQDSNGKLILEPYKYRTWDGREHDVQFGKLWVRENRSSGSKRLIQLSFVLLRSSSPTPAAPVVFLAGGPGAPGILMGRIPPYFTLFDKLRALGDVILLDQRGIGLSVPNLECSSVNTPTTVFKNEQTWMSTYENMARACAKSWKEKGVDISAYTNEANADDIEDLRKALKAEKVSLLGHSYGTLLATAYVRRHGDNLDKLIMAATEGPDQLLVMPGVWDILIKKLSYIASKDTSINKQIPDFAALYEKVLKNLEARPVSLIVTNQRKQKNDTITVGRIGLEWIIRLYMTDARTYAMLPALIYTIDQGDYSAFAKQIEPYYNSFFRAIMATAIDCSVGWSNERKSLALKETPGALFRTVNLLWINACEWLGTPIKQGSQSRIFSTTPTLFISGTLDTVTPPFQAEEMRWGFPNGYHLIVENGSHESLLDKNVQSVMLDFLKGTDVQQRTVKFDLPDFISVEELKVKYNMSK